VATTPVTGKVLAKGGIDPSEVRRSARDREDRSLELGREASEVDDADDRMRDLEELATLACEENERLELALAELREENALLLRRLSANELPSELAEVISLTPAMWPNWRSSGVATDEAMISALAPGSDELTEMVGKSTWGSGATGRTLNAIPPAMAMPTVISVVATGR